MNGLEEAIVLGGECVGVTFTVVKAGAGCSKDLDNNKASSLLKRSDHFWSN